MSRFSLTQKINAAIQIFAMKICPKICSALLYGQFKSDNSCTNVQINLTKLDTDKDDDTLRSPK